MLPMIDTRKLERTLETNRLLLEPLSEEHALHLFAALSDPRIYAFIPQDAPRSLLELQNRYRQLENRQSPAGDELWLNWAIQIRDCGRYIGLVEATIRGDRTALFAYELNPEYWHRGYATEACLRVIGMLFSECNVKEIIAAVDTRNEASYKLLERLLFQRVAIREKADYFKGSNSDEYIYKLVTGAKAV